MMIKFLYQNIIKPYKWQWLAGIMIANIWSIAFIALPAVAGWFLTVCSIVFITQNTTFSYLFPSAIIRFIAIIRTGTRYFDKTKNHRTLLEVQRSMQLQIFKRIANLPYEKKVGKDNVHITQVSLHGIHAMNNYMLLWFVPFCGFIIAAMVLMLLLASYTWVFALIFATSLAVVTLFIPKVLLYQNKMFHEQLDEKKHLQRKTLTELFEASIEIKKYNLNDYAIAAANSQTQDIQDLTAKINKQSFLIQSAVGLGMVLIALLLLVIFKNQNLQVEAAAGLFLALLALAEMAELLWLNKAQNRALKNNLKNIESLLTVPNAPEHKLPTTVFQTLTVTHQVAKIPNQNIVFPSISFKLQKGEWLAILGPTGIGKTTFLKSLFFSEFKQNGHLKWNEEYLDFLSPQKSIYIAQDALLLTGTVRENLFHFAEDTILKVLKEVDLYDWYLTLPERLDTWIGEGALFLSGGQQKKLLLAQAILLRPDLLILDELTAGIDLHSMHYIMSLLKKNYPELTVLLVTHHAELLEQIDHILYFPEN